MNEIVSKILFAFTFLHFYGQFCFAGVVRKRGTLFIWRKMSSKMSVKHRRFCIPNGHLGRLGDEKLVAATQSQIRSRILERVRFSDLMPEIFRN